MDLQTARAGPRGDAETGPKIAMLGGLQRPDTAPLRATQTHCGPSPGAIASGDDRIFEDVHDAADEARSLAISIREAAFRRDSIALRIYRAEFRRQAALLLGLICDLAPIEGELNGRRQ